MNRIYDSNSFKDYMSLTLESAFKRGVRTQLAQFLGVQLSFVSRVLNGTQVFNPELGLKVAKFLALNELETEFLLLLIERDRAGSIELKNYYEKKMSTIRTRQQKINSRVKPDKTRLYSDEDTLAYYGSWYHTAIHMLLRNGQKNINSLASSIGISVELARESIQFLERVGLITQDKNGKWEVKDARFHFSKQSPALRAHHINCRNAAMRSLDEKQQSDLHYSLVMSIDAETQKWLHQKILEFIETIHPQISKAKDEAVHAMTFDFFRVDRAH